MTVAHLCDALHLQIFCLPDPERTVTGGYAGDLLSWVMGRAAPDCAWLTIMSGINVCAVALLADAACVLLTEGVTPDADLLAKAQSQGVNLLGTTGSTFDTAVAVNALL